MHRSYDPAVMREAAKPHPDLFDDDFGFDTWLNTKNIMLVEGTSVGLATLEYPGVYSGHYLFTVGGREALSLARQMIDEMFTKYDAKVMRGLTHETNRKARWFNKKLGFTSYGFVETAKGPHELFMLTKEDFYNGN